MDVCFGFTVFTSATCILIGRWSGRRFEYAI